MQIVIQSKTTITAIGPYATYWADLNATLTIKELDHIIASLSLTDAEAGQLVQLISSTDKPHTAARMGIKCLARAPNT